MSLHFTDVNNCKVYRNGTLFTPTTPPRQATPSGPAPLLYGRVVWGGGLLQGNELLQVGDVPRVRKELNFTQRNVERIQQLLVAYKQERDILQEMLEDNLKVDRQRNIEFETILASDCVVVVAVENILG